MTRKTRRSKPGGDDAAKPGPASPQQDAAAAERQAPVKEGTPAEAGAPAAKPAAEPAKKEPAKKEPAKKMSLPAFGFAKDLLRESAAESQAPTPAIAATDPRRIFAFADSLDRGAAAEPEAVPVRLETWVAFSLAGEVFALPVTPVREVVRVASITRVPHAPKPIRGVTNRRGRVIPVIDLRLRIELPATELGRASRVIIVSSRGRLLGLLVDAVHQVIHIDRAQVQPPPDDVMTVQSDYLSGVYHLDDQLILLLDIDRALIIQDAPAEATGGNAREPDAADAPTGPA